MEGPSGSRGDTGAFIGQTGLVRRIFSRIGADRPQSVAIIGGRRSGKTALLAHLCDEGVRRRFLEKPGQFSFLPLQGGCSSVPDPDAFLHGLLASLPPGHADAGARLYELVRGAVEAQHAAGRRLVVLLDDFQTITGSERFPLEFFSFLRSLANNYNLAYVTTSFLELQKLCAVKDVQESPFFNIFTNLHLGVLPAAEAEALLARLGSITAEETRRVTAWIGGSPWLVRTAAGLLKDAGGVVPTGNDGMDELFRSETGPWFEEVLALLPPAAYRALQAVGRGRRPDPADEHHLVTLVKQGLLVEGDNGPACATGSFERFLRAELSPRMLKGRE